MKYHHLILFFILTIASIASAMNNTSYTITTMPRGPKQRLVALIYCFQQKTLTWLPLLCIEEIFNYIDDYFHPLTKSDHDYFINHSHLFDPYTQKFNINNEQPTDHDNDLLEKKLKQHREEWNKKYPIHDSNPQSNLTWGSQPRRINVKKTNDEIQIFFIKNKNESWSLQCDNINVKKVYDVPFLIKGTVLGEISHVIDNQHIISRVKENIHVYYLDDTTLNENTLIFKPVEHAHFPLEKCVKFPSGTHSFLLENGILSYVSTKHDTTPETNMYHMKIVYPKKYLHNASIKELEAIKKAIKKAIKTETAPKKSRRPKKITKIIKKITNANPFKKPSKK